MYIPKQKKTKNFKYLHIAEKESLLKVTSNLNKNVLNIYFKP